MMLDSKNVLVFAASGAIGGGVARTFAREGAHVWLSGRNAGSIEELAGGIEADGGKATSDVVDATDQEAVGAYVERVAEATGGIDAVFNAIGLPPAEFGYPAPSTTQDLELFLKPARIILGSTFITALRRPITVAETAAVAAFLASEASSGMTGQVVTVAAGDVVG